MQEKELKRLLYNYIYIKENIEECRKEMLNIKELTDCERDIQGIVYTDIPRGTNIADTTQEKVFRILSIYENQVDTVNDRIEGLFRDKNTVETMMFALNDNERRLIELKYFKKYHWWQIEGQINYGRSQCFEIHNKAIQKMCRMTI